VSRRQKSIQDILEMMKKPQRIRNCGFVGHIDHGKTTLSDSLLSEAGLLSPELAGEARVLDFLEEEQRRGITMKAANISLYYEKALEEPFLVNLVDTPGHLDFTGKVTRALRLIDGVVVIVDAVEEIISQSETVIRQALAEGVKPVLYINKVDRLITELKMDASEIQVKFERIIDRFNTLIKIYADNSFKDEWQVSAEDETVVFGSALHRWGFTIPQFVKAGWKFADIEKKYADLEVKTIENTFPVWEAVLRTIIDHLPDPVTAQKYRIAKIWSGAGEMKGPISMMMANCDPSGPLVLCCSQVRIEPHGIVGTGRIFSGTLTRGQKVFLVRDKKGDKVQQVSIFMGARRDQVQEIPAGNIAAITGLQNLRAGETIVAEEIAEGFMPFEDVKYMSHPVLTVAVEPELLRDLNRLHDILKEIQIEDPNIHVRISDDTGEVLMSGMGPLHLEVVEKQILDKGLKITASKPIPIFMESTRGVSTYQRAVSQNGKNSVRLIVLPLEHTIMDLIQNGTITPRKSAPTIVKALKEGGFSKEEAQGFWHLGPYGIILSSRVDPEKEKLFSLELKEQVSGIVDSICMEGPLIKEQLRELKIIIRDLNLTPEPEERTDGELTSMFQEAMFKCILESGPILLEPIYKITIEVPPTLLGPTTAQIAHFQGKVLQVEQREQFLVVDAIISVRKSFEFVDALRGSTAGKAFWFNQFHSFQPVPDNEAKEIIDVVQFRKGLIQKRKTTEINLADIDFKK
jgi:elongation factor 2